MTVLTAIAPAPRDTPVHITEAAIRALHEGYTHYTPAAGLPEARAAVAEYVSHPRGIAATPEALARCALAI